MKTGTFPICIYRFKSVVFNLNYEVWDTDLQDRLDKQLYRQQTWQYKGSRDCKLIKMWMYGDRQRYDLVYIIIPGEQTEQKKFTFYTVQETVGRTKVAFSYLTSKLFF